MEDFVKIEGAPTGRLPIPEAKRKAVEGAAEHCDRKSHGKFCRPVVSLESLKDLAFAYTLLSAL
jgi:hypothetical protein